MRDEMNVAGWRCRAIPVIVQSEGRGAFREYCSMDVSRCVAPRHARMALRPRLRQVIADQRQNGGHRLFVGPAISTTMVLPWRRPAYYPMTFCDAAAVFVSQHDFGLEKLLAVWVSLARGAGVKAKAC